MSNKYFSLLSSLPMLRMGEAPGISMDEFLSSCSVFIRGEKWDLLCRLNLVPQKNCSFAENTLAAEYYQWENALRNSIARLRAAKLGNNFEQFIRQETEFEISANRSAAAAYAMENPLERERVLDTERWNKIEELELGEIFSFDLVCAYCLKLQIVSKWSTRNQDQAKVNLEQAAGNVRTSGTEPEHSLS